MISGTPQQRNQGPGILFLIWILLFWEKGESLVSQQKLLLSLRVKTFCMSAWRATSSAASCSWCRAVTTARATGLLPPGNVPGNTGERAGSCSSVCRGRDVVIIPGARTPWASSLPGSPRGWQSFDFSSGFMSSIPFLIIKPHSQERYSLYGRIIRTAVCCISCVHRTDTTLYTSI